MGEHQARSVVGYFDGVLHEIRSKAQAAQSASTYGEWHAALGDIVAACDQAFRYRNDVMPEQGVIAEGETNEQVAG